MTTIFKHKLPIANAVASFSLLLFIVACTQNKQEKTSDNVENKIDSVKVFTIETDTVKKILVLPAELLPLEDAQIRAKVPGYVRKMLVDIGTKVTKGQVLALIEAPELNTRIQELKDKAMHHTLVIYPVKITLNVSTRLPELRALLLPESCSVSKIK